MYPVDLLKDFIRYWAYPVLRPRQFHAFCVGMPKTGTHSLDAIFAGHYRSFHEPRIVRYMEIARKRREGEISESRTRELIRGLERRLWLELNSAYVNYFFLDIFVDDYPDAKFILTIRDCYSWMDSLINQLLGREHGDYQIQFHKWFGDSMTNDEHTEKDQPLAEHGFWPLNTWFSYWNEQNSYILNTVPSERLLVVRTHEIQRDIPKMAEFLGISPDTLNASRSHEFKAAKKFGLLAQIDREYLEQSAEKHCGELMKRYFPEIKHLTDVRGYEEQDAQIDLSKTS